MGDSTKSYLKPLHWGFFLLLTFLSSASFGQTPPFHKGEELKYELVYNWGLIWAKAGAVTFTVNDTLVDNQKYYHFHSFGRSYDRWDWFYEVRSTYESWANLQMESQRFIRKGKEGSHFYDRVYDVKPSGIYATFKDEEGKVSYKSMPYSPEARDVITAVYYCRTLDFSSYSPNDSIPLTFFLDGAIYPSYVRFLGEEEWVHPRTGLVHRCWVFKPKLIEGTVFKSGENMTVYVTKDEQKIPVYIETDLVVGKAKVFLLE